MISVLTWDALEYPDEMYEFYVGHGIPRIGFNVKAHDGGPDFPSAFRLPQTFLIDSPGRLIANKSGDWDWTSIGVKVLIRRLIGGI